MARYEDTSPPGEDEGPSKSELKRQMTYLQELGEQLLKLNEKQLANFPLTEKLRNGLQETRNIKKREALRRHKQFLGKVMRDEDQAGIENALKKITIQNQQEKQLFHKLEQLRDKLVDSGIDAIDIVVAEFPNTDRQQLRQLVRQIKSDTPEKKLLELRRKIFRFLKNNAANQS